MKILLINDSSNLIGGAEVMIQTLRKGLRERGHDARFFTSLADSDPKDGLADYYCFGTKSSFRTLLQTANPWAYWSLRKVLKEFRPDVVHVKIFLTQISPWILPLLKDIPSLYHVVWYRPICPVGTKMLPDGSLCQSPAGTACYQNHCLPLRDWLPLMLQKHWFREWCKVFKLYVANSEFVRNRLVSEGIEPVEMIWNGVPLQPLRPPLSDPPTAVFSGHLSLKKGADILIKAFAKVVSLIPQAKLFVAGEGPEENRLKKLIQTLGLSSHVVFLGFLENPEIESIFSKAWVQVVPSRWEEPFGLVAAEAMMRGTAVIASRSGGLTEIVCEAETGFLVEPGNEDELAGALGIILKDRELAERMGRAGRHVALDQFQEGIFLEKFINFYERLLGNKKSNPARQTEEVFS